MIPHDVHLHIGSLLFEGIDQIDLTGPFEVLSRIPNATYRIYGKTTSLTDILLDLRFGKAATMHVREQADEPLTCAEGQQIRRAVGSCEDDDRKACTSRRRGNQSIPRGGLQNHLLEVVAASTITNYTGSIIKPPLEAPFKDHAWQG